MKNQSSTFDALKILKNRMGMSLIEILIALGMVGILSSVIATIMETMQRTQNQANVINTLETMRLNIQKLASDGTAWRATVALAANANLLCVRTNTTCPDSGAALIQSNSTVTNATLDAAPFMDLPHLEQANGGSYIDTQTSATSGYTEKGVPCNTFNAATGDDSCPIRWKVKMAFECQAGGINPCFNPTIRVIGILYFRQSGASGRKTIINENKYRVDIRRGAQGDTRSERFAAEYVALTAGPNDDGGPCTPSRAIPFNQVTLNENNNVAVAGAGTILNFQAGTYTCTAVSSCFACGQVHLELQRSGTMTNRSVTLLSKRWDQTQVSISNASFTINAVTPVQIVQFCSTPPGNDGTLAGITMGMSLPLYTAPTKFSEIQCTRIF